MHLHSYHREQTSAEGLADAVPCRPGFHVTFTSAGRALERSLGLQRQSSATIPLGERQQDEINCRRESPVSRMALSLELLALSGSSGCRAFFRSLDPLFRGLGSVWVSWAALLYVPHLVQSPSTHSSYLRDTCDSSQAYLYSPDHLSPDLAYSFSTSLSPARHP